jgi:hypothetical protein
MGLSSPSRAAPRHPLAALRPNETVEKVQFSYFLKKTPFENQRLMSDDFQVLGFFDSLNAGVRVSWRSWPPRNSGASRASLGPLARVKRLVAKVNHMCYDLAVFPPAHTQVPGPYLHKG